MHIQRIVLTGDRVRISHYGGIEMEYSAEDAIKLHHWLLQKQDVLIDLYRQELRRDEQRRKETVE